MHIARKRSGLTLMEVLVSLAIFLLSLGAIGQLISVGSDYALAAQFKQEGTFLCYSKLAELEAGAEPLQNQNGAAFQNDPNWTWSCTCQSMQQQPPMLMQVQVTVQRQRQFGSPIVVTMSKMIIDPANRGSTLDPEPPPVTETDGSQSSSSSSSSSSSGGS